VFIIGAIIVLKDYKLSNRKPDMLVDTVSLPINPSAAKSLGSPRKNTHIVLKSNCMVDFFGI
jgi:hypothetical protein